VASRRCRLRSAAPSQQSTSTLAMRRASAPTGMSPRCLASSRRRGPNPVTPSRPRESGTFPCSGASCGERPSAIALLASAPPDPAWVNGSRRVGIRRIQSPRAGSFELGGVQVVAQESFCGAGGVPRNAAEHLGRPRPPGACRPGYPPLRRPPHGPLCRGRHIPLNDGMAAGRVRAAKSLGARLQSLALMDLEVPLRQRACEREPARGHK
jgi:hypothetical protein